MVCCEGWLFGRGNIVDYKYKSEKVMAQSGKSEYITGMVEWKALSDKIKNFGYFIGAKGESLKNFEH